MYDRFIDTMIIRDVEFISATQKIHDKPISLFFKSVRSSNAYLLQFIPEWIWWSDKSGKTTKLFGQLWSFTSSVLVVAWGERLNVLRSRDFNRKTNVIGSACGSHSFRVERITDIKGISKMLANDRREKRGTDSSIGEYSRK